MDTRLADRLTRDDRLIDLVAFKWLMGGVGVRVDLSRLQRDFAYAGDCARRGMSSEFAVLRRRSQELLALLDGGE
jgi:hypothetical protein